jgi:transposase
MIIAFMKQGFSDIEIRSLFKVGGSRVKRVKAQFSDTELRAQRMARKTPIHAFSDEDKQRVFDQIESWNVDLEDGFPCSHRRQMRYFIKEGVTWKKLHEEYEERIDEIRVREANPDISKMKIDT